MGGEHPKALRELNGSPIIGYLLRNIASVCERPTIVVGYKADEVMARLGNAYQYALQREQLGTAHAVMCAKEGLMKKDATSIVVLYCDHPLVSAGTVRALGELREHHRAAIAFGTLTVPGFEDDFAVFREWGRIVRAHDGTIVKIVEVKDATEEEKKIREVSPSYFCFKPEWLWANLERVQNHNVKKEYYLTDLVTMAIQDGETVVSMPVSAREAMGANTPEELAIIRKYL